MTKNLEEMLTKRPVNRKNVDTHKKRMLEEVRSYRLRELRKASDMSQVELAERLNGLFGYLWGPRVEAL